MRFWIVTTFANKAWDEYASHAVHSLVKFLPQHFKLCVGLDNELMASKVKMCLEGGEEDTIFTNADTAYSQSAQNRGEKLTVGTKRNYEILTERSADHREFITLHAGRDHPHDYRMQAARFCHKIFFLKHFFDEAIQTQGPNKPAFVVWWDADAHLTRPVTEDEFLAVMPDAHQACSYLGRKDWDHSECGFMGFNVEHQGATDILDFMVTYYKQGLVFSLPQWHDSYLFDVARDGIPCKNISEGVAGNNVWAKTNLGLFSEHWKGPQAKTRKKALTDEELFSENKPNK